MDRTAVVAFREGVVAVDVDGLDDRARVELVAELERVKGAVAAAQARLTHALRRSREQVAARDIERSVGSEVALARRCSPTLGDRHVGLARALVEEMPATMSALSSGVCSEAHAVVVARATAVLSVEDRAEVDRRVGPLLGRLGVVAAERAARRVAAELDAAAVVRRMEDAVRSRRVTVRPAPDGMAYLTVLGPMVEVVGAHAALQRRARSVVGGQCPHKAPDGRGVGAVSADTALRLLSGRVEPGAVQPVEVHLVMTDRALLGSGDPARSVMEPARVPGHGCIPAPVVRRWLREPGDDAGSEVTSVWLRRLYTEPHGRDLVAMDSRRRLFTGLLRRMLVLRDDVCRTPWCGAAIVHADHARAAREGGATSYANGDGTCARCTLVREAPGWSAAVRDVLGGRFEGSQGTGPNGDRDRDRDDIRGGPGRGATPNAASTAPVLVLTSGVGVRYASTAPPLLGWGSDIAAGPQDHPRRRDQSPSAPRSRSRRRAGGRRRDRDGRPPKRPLLTSRLERQLCRYLT